MQIVESLKQALNQMEDVLELVEVAERQKLGDEREIDSLRRLCASCSIREAAGASGVNMMFEMIFQCRDNSMGCHRRAGLPV